MTTTSDTWVRVSGPDKNGMSMGDGQVTDDLSSIYRPAGSTSVFPFVEVSYAVIEVDEDDATDGYRFSVLEATAYVRSDSDMDYTYDYPSAYDYETLERATQECERYAARDLSTYLASPQEV